jgi:repressor LexA
MKELTARQQQVLHFIQDFTDENVFPPSVREIAEHFSISIKAVQDHIAALRKKGYLSQSAKRSRSLKVLKETRPEVQKTSFVEIPLLGTIAAGKPLFCDENYENTLHLSQEFVKDGQKYFALHVRGTSMKDAGILDGDVAIVRQCNSANDGEIVVALIDDSVTLKRFFKESTRIRLQPENPDFKPIYSQDVQVLGVLSNILRTY